MQLLLLVITALFGCAGRQANGPSDEKNPSEVRLCGRYWASDSTELRCVDPGYLELKTLAEFPNLRSLELGALRPLFFAPDKGCPRLPTLERLVLHQAVFEDTTCLSALTSLRHLELVEIVDTPIDFVSSFRSLESVYIEPSRVRPTLPSLDPLVGLPALRSLAIGLSGLDADCLETDEVQCPWAEYQRQRPDVVVTVSPPRVEYCPPCGDGVCW